MTGVPRQSAPSLDNRAIEREQQRKYRTCYGPANLDYRSLPSNDYFARLAALRLRLLQERYEGGRILDLGCGAGDYLLPAAQFAEAAIGLDFSPELIAVAQQRATAKGAANVSVAVANGRNIPLRDESISLIFSFSCLYHIPAVDQVIAECARVLRRGGTAILEFGALYSLNTIVCRAYPELAAPCHVPLREFRAMLSRAGLTIEMDRPFQILPLWGNKPWWLRPILHPFWKQTLQRQVAGRMLDEWISALWPFRVLAFRHIVICRRT